MAQRKTVRLVPQSAPRVRGRRERHKADIRHRLFRAALALFATRGFAATTVEDITRAADVAKGTFFNYFPTKEHLLMEFGEVRLDIIRVARDRALETREPVRETLHKLLRNLARDPGESRAMARSVLIGMLGDQPVAAMARGRLMEGRHILAEVMDEGRRRGEIRSEFSSEEAAQLFQQLFFGGLHLWTLDLHLNLRRHLDRTFALFWSGVGTQQQFSRKRTK